MRLSFASSRSVAMDQGLCRSRFSPGGPGEPASQRDLG